MRWKLVPRHHFGHSIKYGFILLIWRRMHYYLFEAFQTFQLFRCSAYISRVNHTKFVENLSKVPIDCACQCLRNLWTNPSDLHTVYLFRMGHSAWAQIYFRTSRLDTLLQFQLALHTFGLEAQNSVAICVTEQTLRMHFMWTKVHWNGAARWKPDWKWFIHLTMIHLIVWLLFGTFFIELSFHANRTLVSDIRRRHILSNFDVSTVSHTIFGEITVSVGR